MYLYTYTLLGRYLDINADIKENLYVSYASTYMSELPHIGAQIRAARIASGLSLRKLGASTKIPATTIEGYEAGNRVPADNFLRIADALNHQTFTVDGQSFTVSREGAQSLKPTKGEQLKLDFSGEYDYSRATVRIGPGRITLAFDATRSSRDKKTAP